MTEEIRLLKLERKDSVLKRQHSELSDRIEILMLENKSLKELIREKEETERQQEATTKDGESKVNGEIETENTENGRTDHEHAADQNCMKSSRSPVLTETTEIAYV